jgi:hypothetical protein
MGMAYKARDRQLGETIALKVLRPDVARASAASSCFRPPVHRPKRPQGVTLRIRGLDAANYYWRVAAIDKDGAEGSFSDRWRFVVAKVLQLKGRTETGASVTANGQRLDVQPDGEADTSARRAASEAIRSRS